MNTIKDNKIYINEVSPRDGFQNEKKFIETCDKVNFINRLSACGFNKIEVTSFTSPRAIPALSDAKNVMDQIERNPEVLYTALVPNMRGAERALECKLDEINLVMSVSNSHNLANMMMTRDKSFQQLSQVIKQLKKTNIRINVSLSTVFGCPMEGDVPVYDVLRLVEHFTNQDISRITLCDTTGMAYPTQVSLVANKVLDNFKELELVMHFHDTRGMALVNVMASLNAGVVHFDASLGGIGGCPYAPGASGNVATEEVVYMLELMGYDTGLNINDLLVISQDIPHLIGRETNSQLVKAGLRTNLHLAPDINY